VLGPTSWARGVNPPSGGGPPQQSSKPVSTLPPRFQQQQQLNANRFQGLSSNEDRLSSSNQGPPSSAGYRDQMPPLSSHQSYQQPQNLPPPSYRKQSPPTSSASSRENSRPVSPKDSRSLAGETEITADVNETVKNIFEEYVSVGKSDDTLHWIQQRFPGKSFNTMTDQIACLSCYSFDVVMGIGSQISDFVDELARQVGDMAKLVMQQKAGTLTRALLKANLISKDLVSRHPNVCVKVNGMCCHRIHTNCSSLPLCRF
jgi:hypothetical protein